MNRRQVFITGIFVLLIAGGRATGAAAQHQHESEYAGQEARQIKSLSADDVEALRAGQGWGLAKAAELNGVPGPVHLLDMKEEIGLTEDQRADIERLYEAMKGQAITLGLKLIDLEAELDASFADKTADEASLTAHLGQIADVYKELRYVHLSAHLKTPEILTRAQIEKYNELRGYGAADPCASVPEGHDPEMWKKHNGCG
jgi:Spy/CpxP family protein refolding chaperone